MCQWIVRVLWICNGLRKFVRNKVNSLKRHVHGQLRRIAPVECEYPFLLIYILYTIQYIPVRGVVHL